VECESRHCVGVRVRASFVVGRAAVIAGVGFVRDARLLLTIARVDVSGIFRWRVARDRFRGRGKYSVLGHCRYVDVGLRMSLFETRSLYLVLINRLQRINCI
jgi:hypothetical protein